MRPVRVSVTGVGVSPVIPTDWRHASFDVGLGVVVQGTATYTVEYTFDDVFSETFNPATATWFPHQDLTGLTANKDSNLAFPPTGMRLNVTAGTGKVTLNYIQAGAIA
jgi:hypothetical protein